jgi:hypothetical protein
MLTLSRQLVRQIRILFSRGLDVPRRQLAQCAVIISAGPHGLTIRAQANGGAAEYRETTPQPPVELVSSLHQFYAIEGNKSEPVTFVRTDDGLTTARWQEGAIPRAFSSEPLNVDPQLIFPAAPTTWSDNPPELWAALAAAQGSTDPHSSRYALGCLQLRGQDGRVAATDGSQLFRQSGFQFGFQEEVLIPGLALFTSGEVPKNLPVSIGRLEKDIVLRSGPWTFWLPIREGRFPRVDDVVPSIASSCTKLVLPSADQQFVKTNLPKLRCAENEAVTLDLNGEIAIRTRESDAAPPTQLVLRRASYTGQPMTVVSARRYLQRAIELGFQEIDLLAPDAIIVCRGTNRDYVWMPWSIESAVKATSDTIDIVSTSTAVSNRLPSPIPHTPAPMPTNSTAAVPSPTSNRVKPRTKAAAMNKASLIEQCQSLRSKLRELLAETNELVRAAKRQRQSERLVRTTLASLKQLQAAG